MHKPQIQKYMKSTLNIKNHKLAFFAALAVLSFGSITLIPQYSQAKIWRNAYMSFELPEKWNCVLEQTEWVCRSTEPGLAEAIVILTAKEVGPQDSQANYEAHLKLQKTIMTRSGIPVKSTVYKTELRTISSQPWVDSLHFSSEIYNYYTRYLATTKDKIAVLITFSAHKLHYSKYSADFFRAIESLHVIATKSNWSAQEGTGSGILGVSVDSGMPQEPNQEMESGGNGSNENLQLMLGAAVIAAAGGVYLLLKRSKKRK